MACARDHTLEVIQYTKTPCTPASFSSQQHKELERSSTDKSMPAAWRL